MYTIIAKFTLDRDYYTKRVIVALKDGVYYCYNACYSRKYGNKLSSNLHRIDDDYYRENPSTIYRYIVEYIKEY